MKVAINGFGRIGRAVLKIALAKGIKVVAINDLTSPENLAYLLQYDTVYDNYEKRVSFGEDFIKIGWKKIKILAQPDPEELPWKKLKVDTVVESTGRFKHRMDAGKHIQAGAKRVVISAPAKDPDVTVVPGVNLDMLKKEHQIISVASCTTNCLAPVAKVLNDNFKIKKGFMTTVHAYTTTQKLLDGPHKKFRRGRAAAANIVPTTSGATTAIGEVLPELKYKLNGLAMRVPVLCGSIVDFVAEIEVPVIPQQINEALKKAAEKEMKGIIEYSDHELVSSAIIKNPHSAIIDGLSTQVIGNASNLIKVLAWYDNEWGYSNRMVDVLRRLK